MGYGGRPTTYGEEVINKALVYLGEFDLPMSEREGRVSQEVVPTVVGLCRYINRSKATVYFWCDHEDKKEFLDIIKAIEELQHIALVSGGLSGGMNSQIVKLMLSKHGYSEKSEVDHSSKDGSMTPKAFSSADYEAAKAAIKKDLDNLD